MKAKIRNWDGLLLRAAARRVGEPFAWGTTDCASLVRWAAGIMWGTDLWPEIPGWDSLAVAARVVQEYGTVATILEASGYVPVDRWWVQTGDVIIDPAAYDGLGSAGTVLAGTHLLGSDEETGVTIQRLEHEWPTGITILGWRPHG